jgi:uncharacterized membrane protein YjgN (DUF898 family)
MALVITAPNTLVYDPNVVDSSGGFAILAASNNNDQEALARLLELPTFQSEVTTTGGESVAIAFSVATLAALGVAFPLGSIRNVRVRVYSRITTANGGYTERTFTFRGAATIGTVSLVADGTTLATAFTVQSAISFDGTNFGIANAGVDGTSGPFITVFSAATGTLTTAAAVNARHRVEVYVDPLVILNAF